MPFKRIISNGIPKIFGLHLKKNKLKFKFINFQKNIQVNISFIKQLYFLIHISLLKSLIKYFKKQTNNIYFYQ